MHGQEESIYSLIPREEQIHVPPLRHISRHESKVHPSTLPFGQTKLQGHASFGTPNGTNAHPPQHFLRKHEKEPVLPTPTSPSNPKTKLRASVPDRNDKPIMGLTSNKDYITTNAVGVILAKPGKVPQPDFQWTSRPGYGMTPAYLKRNMQQVQQEKDSFEQYVRMRTQPTDQQHVSQLEPTERKQLLRHLKTKWGTVNTAYQKLSFVLDSDMAKQRKEELERQLAEFEKDIKMLERGESVLVVQG
eukprot:gene2685-12918_t